MSVLGTIKAPFLPLLREPPWNFSIFMVVFWKTCYLVHLLSTECCHVCMDLPSCFIPLNPRGL